MLGSVPAPKREGRAGKEFGPTAPPPLVRNRFAEARASSEQGRESPLRGSDLCHCYDWDRWRGAGGLQSARPGLGDASPAPEGGSVKSLFRLQKFQREEFFGQMEIGL